MVRSIAVMLGLILVIPAHAGPLGGVDMGREIESRRRDADREVALFSWSPCFPGRQGLAGERGVLTRGKSFEPDRADDPRRARQSESHVGKN